jgi:SAM-dependent methyltransferase
VPEGPAYRYGNRLTSRLTTYLPPGRGTDLLLDLGCGDTELGRYLAWARGYGYLGVDTDGRDATLLADAHCLPFADESFAAACTFAVLEHVRVPHLVAVELHRVLRPDAVVLGSVAFLEPYHLASRSHLSHLGLADVLASAGFTDIAIEPNRNWLVVDALLEMYTAKWYPGRGRVTRPLRALLRGVTFMRRSGERRLARVTAGYRFVARKPSTAAVGARSLAPAR